MNTNLKSVDTILKLTEDTQKLLQCPVCKSKLTLSDRSFKCKNFQCKSEFPIIDGIPILIDDSDSVFAIADFINTESIKLKPKSKQERILINLIPSIGENLKGKQNYKKFAQMLLQQNMKSRVLVIGGSVLGEGMDALLSFPEIEFVESDVCFGSRTALISDAHDIPFDDNSFDGVIIQAVLEHVVDPNRCVEEIHRVLKDDGLVYSETPFIQQVHLGKYDFTRFTHLGHRRLFKKFEEVCSGAACGSAMALAWSYQYFLLSFVKGHKARMLVKAFARITSFWLKYFDYYLINQPGTFDAASSYYFMGRKSDRILSDRQLLTQYKGTQSSSF
ncbi:methyltransferase domain-containing protein [Gloeocapsopsis sp. IPPAS B-1203]|uniref:methyltransferase domain-containing protein n=1 Tax=Gloeocapsopsis sp. IPPAS B-1203 TaxID=2049454 RepID=UPI000C17661F|nr:methyltransferase domain-containing protein [Gloeocapsopsis sp. IPPAS B-1203]PIG94124.1 methyltransferase type 11 [Gloeocapsopsis sp. IPPAS B-1203]